MAPPWTAARTPEARCQAAHGCRPDRERGHDLLAAHRRAVPACQRHLCPGSRPGDPVMTAAALKRELASIRGALASLTPAAPQALGDPVAWAERIAGLSLDPWQREVLLSGAPRLLLNATRQSGKSTAAALKAAWTVLQGGLAVVVSPSLRQSGRDFRRRRWWR